MHSRLRTTTYSTVVGDSWSPIDFLSSIGYKRKKTIPISSSATGTGENSTIRAVTTSSPRAHAPAVYPANLQTDAELDGRPRGTET